MNRKIKKAAVIGSGIMGGGIAAILADAGVKVLLLDIVPFDLTDEEKSDPAARNRMVQAGFDATLAARPALFMSKKNASLVELGNLDDDIDKLADCDWICEVVVENFNIKKDLFAKIAKVRKKGSILSTNTSGIPLKEMSVDFTDEMKQHFLGTHFFNPVRYMHLLELIPGAETSQEVLDFISNFGEVNLGKGIVWAKDTPNFVGNRIGIQSMGYVMQQTIEAGMSLTEVDALFGTAMGKPRTAVFGTADLVGLDTLVHVADNSVELCKDDDMVDTMITPEFAKKMVADGKLGNKTKQGFYKKGFTPEGKRFKLQMDPATGEYVEIVKPDFPCLAAAKKAKNTADSVKAIVYADDKGGKFAWKCLANGLTYAAKRIPEISDTVVEIDNGMKWGYNNELGPFEMWDAVGVKESVAKMEADGIDVPENVKKMVAGGNETFYKMVDGALSYYDFASDSYKAIEANEAAISLPALKANNKTVIETPSASLIDLGDGVFCCEFTTKMNAINAELGETLGKSLEYVEANGKGLVIGNQAGGMPGAFSAGADLKYLKDKIDAKAFTEIDEFIANGHVMFQAIKYASFPVVAAPYGMTLGGGCEVCLASDRMVAHSELFMGLVEMGVGLLPAGGGCLNLWKKYVQALPGDVIKDTDLAKLFIPVFMKIATAAVSMSAFGAVKNGHLTAKDRIVFNRDLQIGEAKKEVLSMVAEGYAPEMKQPITVIGQEGRGMVNAQLFSMQQGGFMSEYDAFLAKRIAYVISGGEVKKGTKVAEEVILNLEREAFVDFCKQEKTVARIDHMLTTGKPLRN